MARITYIEHGGAAHAVDVEDGSTVMDAALDNDIDGIEAECGGVCSCSTCHVYVDDAWIDRLPPIEDMEDTMLDSTATTRERGSRLSCQIVINKKLDGLTVRIPERQH